MLSEIFNDIINELKFGYLKRKHPHKYCYLASISGNKPVNRTVVLRDMTEDKHLIFYTDLRSGKVEQFQNNPNAEALFYHPKKLLQVKVAGKMKVVENEDTIKYYKQKVQGGSTKDYTTQVSPGTPIKNPDHVDYGEKLNFAVLELQTESIESLQLKRPNHIRCVFKKEDDWNGQFLVP
jgi:hypothetical protein